MEELVTLSMQISLILQSDDLEQKKNRSALRTNMHMVFQWNVLSQTGNIGIWYGFNVGNCEENMTK